MFPFLPRHYAWSAHGCRFLIPLEQPLNPDWIKQCAQAPSVQNFHSRAFSLALMSKPFDQAETRNTNLVIKRYEKSAIGAVRIACAIIRLSTIGASKSISPALIPSTAA